MLTYVVTNAKRLFCLHPRLNIVIFILITILGILQFLHYNDDTISGVMNKRGEVSNKRMVKIKSMDTTTVNIKSKENTPSGIVKRNRKRLRKGRKSRKSVKSGHSEDTNLMSLARLPSLVEKWREYGRTKSPSNVLDILSMDKPEYLSRYRNPCFLQDGALKCLPHFMIIGTQKCGTTDLYDKMAVHPHIEKAAVKEPFWWNRQRLQGADFQEYLDLFSKAAESIDKTVISYQNRTDFHPVVTGEASAGTIWDNVQWMDLAENSGQTDPTVFNSHLIHHLLPHTRFILILRDPTSRLYSDYKFFSKGKSYEVSAEDFHQRVVNATNWLIHCLNSVPVKHCLFDPPVEDRAMISTQYQIGFFWNNVARTRLGLYSEYLSVWNEVFPTEQTLVVRLEDYSSNRYNTLNRIYQHIGLEPLGPEYKDIIDDLGVKNTQKKKEEPMLEKTKHLLDAFYKPFNEKLALMLNDARFLWH